MPWPFVGSLVRNYISIPLSGLLLLWLGIRVERVEQHAPRGVLNEVVHTLCLVPPTSVSILVVCGLDMARMCRILTLLPCFCLEGRLGLFKGEKKMGKRPGFGSFHSDNVEDMIKDASWTPPAEPSDVAVQVCDKC